jgi:hypothetical protein
VDPASSRLPRMRVDARVWRAVWRAVCRVSSRRRSCAYQVGKVLKWELKWEESMRSRTAFVSPAAAPLALGIVVLAFAGCGGAKTVATTSAPPLPSQRPIESATYTVNLAGFEQGAHNGSGLAVVSLNASTREICWTFSQLKNVGAPTDARIYRTFPGASGRNGFRLGRTYKASGCVPAPANVLRELTAGPQEWVVSIHTRHFPGGAVRGQV